MHEEDEPPSGEEEDNENAWEGWELESESSDDSSDSGGWIDVESDGGDHLNISDSEDEGKKSHGKTAANEALSTEANRTSTLATTKVCPFSASHYSTHIVTCRFLPRPISR